MTIVDAFNFTEQEWDEVNAAYEAVEGKSPEEMFIAVLGGLSPTERKALALGVLIGKRSQ